MAEDAWPEPPRTRIRCTPEQGWAGIAAALAEAGRVAAVGAGADAGGDVATDLDRGSLLGLDCHSDPDPDPDSDPDPPPAPAAAPTAAEVLLAPGRYRGTALMRR